MKRKLGLLVVVMIVLSTVSLLPQVIARDLNTTTWPTTGWQTSTPEEQGVDSQALVNLLQSNADVHTILAIRHGTVILDASHYPFTSSQPHALFDVTKNFVSTLVGIAIDKGYIKSVKQSIWDFFPKDKTANMDSRKEAITIEDLLTHRSGLSINTYDNIEIYKIADKNVSWVQVMLDKPMQSQPGTSFLALDFNAHLASAIVQIATKMSTADFAAKYLFAPLGITDANWIADPQGVSTGGDHLYMSPLSIAKLGYLYLHGGQWDGQQIVSSDWVTRATSKLMPGSTWTLEGLGYFWQSGLISGTQHRGYATPSVLGDMIWVVPELDLVVVTTNDLSIIGQNITSIINASVSDKPLPANAAAVQEMQATIDGWAHPQARAIKPIPDVMKASSGKVYQLQSNDLGWKSISIDFAKPEEALITIGLPDKEIKLPVGLDNVYRVSAEGLPAEPVWRPIGDVPQMLRAGFLGKRLIVSMGDCMGMEFWTLNIDFSKDSSKLWIGARYQNDDSLHDIVGSS